MGDEVFKFILGELTVKEDEIEVAVISERWLGEDRRHAVYPTEHEQDDWIKLTRVHAEPQDDWPIYPFRIRKILP